MKGTVSTILEPFQNRTSKAGKPYSASKVAIRLENGEEVSVFSFNEVAEGSVVDMEQGENGYWKIVSKKEAAANAQHDEIMKYLKAIYAAVKPQTVSSATMPQNTAVGGATKPTAAPTGPDIARQARDEYRAKQEPKFDEIIPYNDGSDIDLNDIPF